MTELTYKTRSKTSPQGKPMVYFCCHPDDFAYYFDSISEEILALQNCAIWYPKDINARRDEDFLAELKQMNLFVIPITARFLHTESFAVKYECAYAIENNIPILPLMQERSLTEAFVQKIGSLQYLDKYDSDSTALPYEEKLAKFLDAVLLNDTLINKIRSAFDAFVFLSYRKKDRIHARELMSLIHRDEFCRDVAIWYDEFLVPGEDFHDSIAKMLIDSDLFVMAVTPNIINEDNYVLCQEYPMAREAGKPILPVEVVPTDMSAFAETFKDLPVDPIPAEPRVLFETLRGLLQEKVHMQPSSSPEHEFFMGLAYLYGIDVETDHKRGSMLITEAAEAGLTEAMDMLINMYSHSIGVRADYEEARKWLRKRLERMEQKADVSTEQILADLEFCETRHEQTQMLSVRLLIRMAKIRVKFCRLLKLAETDPVRYLLALLCLGNAYCSYLRAELEITVESTADWYWVPYDKALDAYSEIEEFVKTASLSTEQKMYFRAEALLGEARNYAGLAIRRHDMSDISFAKITAERVVDLLLLNPGSFEPDYSRRMKIRAYLEMLDIAKKRQIVENARQQPMISKPLSPQSVSFTPFSLFNASSAISLTLFESIEGLCDEVSHVTGNTLEDRRLCWQVHSTCFESALSEREHLECGIAYGLQAVQEAELIWEETRSDQDAYYLAKQYANLAKGYDYLENVSDLEKYLRLAYKILEELYARFGCGNQDYAGLLGEVCIYLKAVCKALGNDTEADKLEVRVKNLEQAQKDYLDEMLSKLRTAD